MNCIILGDKYQKGMKSKGCAGLIKFDKHINIFQHQYNTIKKYFPRSKICYIGGYEAKKIENFIHKNYSDVIFITNTDFEKSNDTYSLSLVKEYFDHDLLILFGYTILQKNIFDKFNRASGSQIFINNQQNHQIGCVINNNRIENISFDLPNTISDIYYISSKDALYFKDRLHNKYYNYFIFEILNDLIDKNDIVFTPFYNHTNKAKHYEHTK
jgi:CTP:phosphocholine cytidylyltransferase-like protein